MIFLPIKPEYAFAIKNKKKRVEFRKTLFRNRKNNYCIVYASNPYKKIVGYFKFKKIEEGTPSVIWKKYNKIGAIEKKDFNKYYENKNKAYAIKISKFFAIKDVDPLKKIEGFKIPQSFYYLSPDEVESLLPRLALVDYST